MTIRGMLLASILITIIVILGFLGYGQWEDKIMLKAELDQSRVDAALALQATNEDIAIIRSRQQVYLKTQRISKQPKGKYEMVIVSDKH